MKTFSVQTLGCKVNQYESEQVAAYLRNRGLRQCTAENAELRIINTCSVTVQAASQSRQAVRRSTRLPVLSSAVLAVPRPPSISDNASRPRVIVIGCWATSDKPAAAAIDGVDAVLTHKDNLAAEFDRLFNLWHSQDPAPAQCPLQRPPASNACDNDPQLAMETVNREDIDRAAAENRSTSNKPIIARIVNDISSSQGSSSSKLNGSLSLPLLGEHQSGRQRAFLKIQDGCDAHCTYCIIPQLRPSLWSKPVEDAVEEARKLVYAGHREIVLTGIFLGAYGQRTALRRRQAAPDRLPPLARLIEALCTRVPNLARLRLSSLEPGDLDDRLLKTLASFQQVVPHFHVPLQSGSDALLRRMNRQYRRQDFLRLVDQLLHVFDRPALTTDIIVGFPGESDEQFQHTLDVVNAARFIHIHAFPFSPRPGTAAVRWKKDLVPGSIVNDRLRRLTQLSQTFNRTFCETFLGEDVTVITERGTVKEGDHLLRRGRCERYFAVDFEGPDLNPGEIARVRIDRVTSDRTYGTVIRGANS